MTERPDPDAEGSPNRYRDQPPSRAVHRLTLRVPTADTSIQEWWAAQHDPSVSVRSLIRDEIERQGFTDTVNRPVAQQARRGRPPVDGQGESEAEPSSKEAAEAQPIYTATELPAPVSTRPVDGAAPAPGVQLEMDDFFPHIN